MFFRCAWSCRTTATGNVLLLAVVDDVVATVVLVATVLSAESLQSPAVVDGATATAALMVDAVVAVNLVAVGILGSGCVVCLGQAHHANDMPVI